MTEALFFLCICAGIGCIGIGFAGIGFFIAVLTKKYWIRQTFNYTYYPRLYSVSGLILCESLKVRTIHEIG